MKPILFSKLLGQSTFPRMCRLALVVPALMITITLSQAGTTEPAAEPAAEESLPGNWINLIVGGAFVSGDDAGFQRRTQTNDFYGGIESMGYTQEIDDSTTFTLEGHAIPGLEDYEILLGVEKTDLGYVKAGFKQFRTWYDATGGYLQGANMGASRVNTLFDDERSIDRGEIFFETGLRMEDFPEITFSYRHLYREGDKDSTCWGDTLANTSWGGITGSNPAFKLMPALWYIDETTDIFELDVEHTLGNTDLGAGLVYETYSLDNSRYTPRWGNKAALNTPGLNDVTLTEKTDADIFAGNIHSVTRFNDKAWLSFAASYSSMDTDIDGGSRTYGVYWPLPLPTVPPNANAVRDYAYDQMSGGSNLNQFITNLNFMWVPVTDLTITPSLRYENESIDTFSSFRAFNTNQTWQGLQAYGAYTDMDSMTGALDIRYTGIENIVLYAKGLWGNENEDILRLDGYLPGEFLDTDVDIDEQEYVLGANWYPLRNLSFSVQGLHRERDQSLDHNVGDQPEATAAPGGANNFRPIMTEHNTETEDVNIRMTWRPASNVTLVTRYDYCQTEYENEGINWSPPAGPVIFPLIQSGEIQSHILSQNITWNPMERLYLQGTVSWITSETDTPERFTGDADNDYLFASLTAGYSIDARTEITANYSFYDTSNYVASQGFTGVGTMGYGYNTEEHAIGLTLTRILNANMVWNLRYAFITSNTDSMPDQTGGWNDFDAHMVSTGLQIRF